MKARLIVPLVGLALGFALLTLTQEKSAVDPEVRQRIEAVLIGDNTYRKVWVNLTGDLPIRIYEITRSGGRIEFCGATLFALNLPPTLEYYKNFEECFLALFGRPF